MLKSCFKVLVAWISFFKVSISIRVAVFYLCGTLFSFSRSAGLENISCCFFHKTFLVTLKFVG